MEGIPTGVDFLDAGADGFFRAKPYMAFGASGTGKSIFGLQYAHAGLQAGESALYVCREKADDLIQQAERFGFPFSQYVDNEQLILLEYDEGFREIVARSGPEAVLVELQAEVEGLGVRRIVLDPVDPFFSSMDDETILRSELRMLTARFEEMGWSPLMLSDSGVMQQPFVLRVFSEVCWGLFELQRGAEGDEGPDHSLLVYKMRNVQLKKSRFDFTIGEAGISGGGPTAVAPGRRGFARFKRAAAPAATEETPAPHAELAPTLLPDPVVAPEPVVEAVPRAAAEPVAEAVPRAAVEPVVEAVPRAAEAAAVAEPHAPVAPRPAAGSSSGADDLELLDDDTLDELEQLARRRRKAGVASPRVQPSAPPPVEVAPNRRPGLSATVLVIEADEEARREVARTCGSKIDVLEAADGVAGLRLAAVSEPDLVLMGARMPRLNGIGLCRILRELRVTVPIVLLCSPHAGPGELPRALAAGADAALPKPIDERRLRATMVSLLRARPPGSQEWPAIDVEAAPRMLLPRTLARDELEPAIERVRSWAEDAGVPVSLVGYEFRFVDGASAGFVAQFRDVLARSIRAEDALAELDERRLVAVLVDADGEGAHAVVRRVHTEMAGAAEAFLGEQTVKPKALFRLLTLQPDRLADDAIEPPYVERLFQESSQLIEEDVDERPGEPVEKYPLIEAVYHALAGEQTLVTSPIDGASHEISVGADGLRAATIDAHRYRRQSGSEETPAGFRARSGACILWVETVESPPRVVARVEEGRVFRGREA